MVWFSFCRSDDTRAWRAAGLFIHHLLAACGLRAWSNRPVPVRCEQVDSSLLLRYLTVRSKWKLPFALRQSTRLRLCFQVGVSRQGLWFGTRGSEVQILSPRPFLVLGALEDEVEGLSVCGPDVYTIRRAVQKYHLNQLPSFCVIPRKIQKMRLVREF